MKWIDMDKNTDKTDERKLLKEIVEDEWPDFPISDNPLEHGPPKILKENKK